MCGQPRCEARPPFWRAAAFVSAQRSLRLMHTPTPFASLPILPFIPARTHPHFCALVRLGAPSHSFFCFPLPFYFGGPAPCLTAQLGRIVLREQALRHAVTTAIRLICLGRTLLALPPFLSRTPPARLATCPTPCASATCPPPSSPQTKAHPQNRTNPTLKGSPSSFPPPRATVT